MHQDQSTQAAIEGILNTGEARAEPSSSHARAGGTEVMALIRGSAAERRKAVEALYTGYATRFRRYYTAHGASDAEADDWVQETFVRVVRSAASIRDDSRLPAWLWKTARNVMIDSIRRSGREQSGNSEAIDSAVDPHGQPPTGLQREGLQTCVRAAFDRFAAVHPERAQCIIWATVDGLSMQEIADILDRSAGATREYLSQCRKKLRPFLEHCLQELD